MTRISMDSENIRQKLAEFEKYRKPDPTCPGYMVYTGPVVQQRQRGWREEDDPEDALVQTLERGVKAKALKKGVYGPVQPGVVGIDDHVHRATKAGVAPEPLVLSGQVSVRIAERLVVRQAASQVHVVVEIDDATGTAVMYFS